MFHPISRQLEVGLKKMAATRFSVIILEETLRVVFYVLLEVGCLADTKRAGRGGENANETRLSMPATQS